MPISSVFNKVTGAVASLTQGKKAKEGGGSALDNTSRFGSHGPYDPNKRRAVTFDFFDCLVNYRLITHYVSQVGRENGIDSALVERLFILYLERLKYCGDYIPYNDLLAQVLMYLDMELNSKCFEPTADELYILHNDLRLHQDVMPCLRQLKENGFELYLMANCPTSLVSKHFERMEDLFNDKNTISSDESKCYKPRLDFFKLANNKFKLSSADHFHVSSSYFGDIMAANKMHWDSVYVNRTKTGVYKENEPSVIITTMADLEDAMAYARRKMEEEERLAAERDREAQLQAEREQDPEYMQKMLARQKAQQAAAARAAEKARARQERENARKAAAEAARAQAERESQARIDDFVDRTIAAEKQRQALLQQQQEMEAQRAAAAAAAAAAANGGVPSGAAGMPGAPSAAGAPGAVPGQPPKPVNLLMPNGRPVNAMQAQAMAQMKQAQAGAAGQAPQQRPANAMQAQAMAQAMGQGQQRLTPEQVQRQQMMQRQRMLQQQQQMRQQQMMAQRQGQVGPRPAQPNQAPRPANAMQAQARPNNAMQAQRAAGPRAADAAGNQYFTPQSQSEMELAEKMQNMNPARARAVARARERAVANARRVPSFG